MKYLSLCSGMEAASVAFMPLGWTAGAFSEIDPACCDLLAHYYPEVPNLGDMTELDFIERAQQYGPFDVVCGGTPCQSFSVAGLRKGLDDDRGNLTLRFVEICDAIKPAIVIWENVPGVLSDKTNAFGCLLAGLVGCDTALPVNSEFGWTDAGMVIGPQRAAAWTIKDAQYFHLAQRRRRVYVVAVRAGERFNPGQILFEPESVRRHSPPSREKGEGTAADAQGRAGVGSERDIDRPLTSRPYADNTSREGNLVPDLSHTLRAEADASEDGTGRGTPLIPSWWNGGGLAETLNVSSLGKQQAMPDKGRFAAVLEPKTYDMRGNGDGDVVNTLNSDHPSRPSDMAPLVLAARTAQTSANGQGVAEGVAHTLDGANGQCIAFTQNQSGDLLTGDVCPAMGTNQNATGRNTPKVMSYRTSGNCGVMEQGDKVAALTQSTDPCAQIIMEDGKYGNANEADASEILRILREKVGEEAYAEWRHRVLDTLQQAQILRSDLHGEKVDGEEPCEAASASKQWTDAGEEQDTSWFVRNVREAECEGCSPQEQEYGRQQARKSDEDMQVVPQQNTQTEIDLLNLWQTREGTRILQHALVAIQKMGRPASDKGQSVCGATERDGTKSQKDMQVSWLRETLSREWILRHARTAGETRQNLTQGGQGSSMAVRRLTPL